MFKYLKSVFNFREQKKQLLYILLVCFIGSFAVARVWSLFVGNSIYFLGYHIHHFYFGMVVLTAGGLLGVLTERKRYRRVAAALIGVGMGLFADEIGLLLNCTTTNRLCAYAFPDTFDVVGYICLGLVMVLVLVDFIERSNAKKEMRQNKLGKNQAVTIEPDEVKATRTIQ